MPGIHESTAGAALRGRPCPDVRGALTAETRTPFFTLCESRHAAGSTLARHRHSRPYACIVIEGEFEETRRGGCESASAGTVLIHPPDEEHGDRFGPSGAICVNVAPDAAWLDAMRDEDLFGTRRSIRGEAALRLGRAIRRGLGAHDTAGRLGLEAATLALLSEALTGGTPRESGVGWIDHACEDIRNAPCAHWTLAGIAASARVHPMHVARTFRRRVGLSLGQFVRGERLAWTRAALANPDMPLAAIALDAGFCDESHSIRAFRRHFGTTPGAYRRTRASPARRA